MRERDERRETAAQRAQPSSMFTGGSVAHRSLYLARSPHMFGSPSRPGQCQSIQVIGSSNFVRRQLKLLHRPLRRRRRQPRAGGARHARGILRHVVATLTHIPLRAGPPASMISRGGPGCSSFRRSGPGRPSLSLRSKACGVVVLVVAWAARDAARAVACATARAGTAGRWARTKERVGGGL